MRKLLQQAIAAIEKLPAEVQDAIATRLRAEAADEQAWAESCPLFYADDAGVRGCELTLFPYKGAAETCLHQTRIEAL